MTDIAWNDGDLHTENGDWALGYALPQSIEALLMTGPGHWKEYPEMGIDLMRQLAATPDKARIKIVISEQLAADGIKMKDVFWENESLKIDADYAQ